MVFPLQLNVLYWGQTIKLVVGVMVQPLHAWLKDFFRDGLVVTTLDFQSRGPVFKTTGWLQDKLRWVRFDLIVTMKDIHINSDLNQLTKFTCNSRSTEFKDILPWIISQMITKNIPVSKIIVISKAVKWGICFEFNWKSIETETT